ncbi:MAG: glycoside hydrolase family 125 protein, partial [Eubacteriales bacterium]|nr:glycoside hydrolase family 125 protein [Eubacteriales bacterium]
MDMNRLEKRLEPVMELLGEQKGRMFKQCFLNTLETTVRETEDDTFVITGDIPAMWLRDSTCQVLPCLRFCDLPDMAALLAGVLRRQLRCVALDPYANAFNETANGRHWTQDKPEPSPWVWERKYEIDSLCYPILLAARLRDAGAALPESELHAALQTIVSLWEREQRHEEASDYRFERFDCPPSDTLTREGLGAPTAPTGMTWSGFRPSDDACVYGYLVPSNLFAARMLAEVAAFAASWGDAALKERAQTLRGQILDGVERYALVDDPEFGEIYCYEADGLGHQLLMDDANVPSLLALPFLGVCEPDDPRYLRTRAFVLSRRNPYFYQGTQAEGVGSPHTPAGYVWPISLCVQAMTSRDNDEAARCVAMLLCTHSGTEFMHESFHPDAPEQFTRPWFAWANAMFGELLYRLYEQGRLA